MFDHALPANVVDAIDRGEPIEAIKLLRQATGLGLKEAKDLIDQHVRGEPVSLPVAAVAPVTLPAPVLAALQRGNKIEAIQLLREHTGLGLKEAKDAVDAATPTTPALPADGSPGEVRRSGGLIWYAIAAICAGLVFYLVLFRTG